MNCFLIYNELLPFQRLKGDNILKEHVVPKLINAYPGLQDNQSF